MRIRASSSTKHAESPPSPPPSSSLSSNSNASSSSSSISSSSSSASTPSISSSSSPTRCEGLTLLVKAAAFYSTGSVVGVPYVQRRITIRRKRPKAFVFESTVFGKRQRESTGLSSNFEGSVLQPWKRQRRCQRSIAVSDGSR